MPIVRRSVSVRRWLTSCAFIAVAVPHAAAAQTAETPAPTTAEPAQAEDAAATPQQQPATAAGTRPLRGDTAAQDRATDDKSAVADIVVTGQRLGFSTTSQIKRDAPQSVSVLTTADLRNIPDTVLIDIVRRVPGLQVSQGGGGGIVSIRGLPQVETRLNGRNFPSAIGRNFDISTLPGDLVSGVAVYKTPTADQIEGGVGGVVDFRTRRPLDFKGFAASLTAKGVYTDLDKAVDPFVSGYVSDRWKVGDGDFGLLVGGNYQYQRNTLHLLTADGNVVQSNAGGTNVQAPTSIYKRYFFFNKEVKTVFGSAQYRSNSGLEMAVDVVYNDSNGQGGLQNLAARLINGTPAAPFTLFSGSNIFRSGQYGNVPLESSVNTFNNPLKAFQAGYNVTWTDDRTTISADVNYGTSSLAGFGNNVAMLTTAPRIDYDGSANYPSFVVSGVDPRAIANYRYNFFGEYRFKDSTDDLAGRIDAAYAFDGALRKLQAGMRYNRRTIAHVGGFRAGNITAATALPSANPFAELTRDDLYENENIAQPQWATISYRSLKKQPLLTTRTLFGVSGEPPFNAAEAYDGRETTYASYAMASFAFPVLGFPIDGNVGVRAVRTDVDINAIQTNSNGTQAPINGKRSYTDVLPSINLRITLADEWFLRLAYSKQLSRPDFGQLAPVTFLDVANRAGNTGNIDLKPLRADQYDVSLEHYFGRDQSIYVAGFYKSVDGFIRSDLAGRTFNGLEFRVFTPQNLSKGYIAGGEAGYRQWFRFLPGPLSGLGVQASYTFIDGTRSANPAGIVVPYQQLTKHNYNVSGFYEKYGIIANVNWVWRSRLLEAASGDAGGRPDYRIPFGQLDANFIYQVSPRLNIIVSGVNLTQSLIRRFYQDPRQFGQNALENRRILAGVQIKLGGGI